MADKALWGDVPDRDTAALLNTHGGTVLGHTTGKTKVGQLESIAFSEQQVAGSYFTVNHAVLQREESVNAAIS